VNFVASAVEYLSPTFGQPLMAGFFASPIGNVAIPRAAYFGCHFEKIPITNPLIKSGSNAHDIASSIERSASRARVRFNMSERLPSGRLMRHIPGHLASGTMRGSRTGFLGDP
jgi:hypothetical protein